jgi:hypothetical protein
MQSIFAGKKRLHAVASASVVTLVLLSCTFLVQAQQSRFKRVSPPGATYTTTLAINNSASMVVGSFVDASGVMNAYAFDGSKYRIIHYPASVNFTIATGVNKENVVVGLFVGSDSLNHGFLLKGHTFTRYDVGPKNLGTEISGINDLGNFVGNVGYNGDVQGYVNINGVVTQFDGGPTALATYPYAIDNLNNITGMFIDSNFNAHCFYRATDGSTTQIDYPGALVTVCLGTNDKGVLTGYYEDRNNVAHGFMDTNGTFTSSTLPDIAGITNGGTYVGSFTDPGGVNYGYVRSPQ